MGSLKKFAGWLSGDGTGKSKERVTSTITKMKIFNKRLARQVNKMEVTAKMNRNKAVRARESGDLNSSKMLIKASLQAKKQANITDNFRIKIEGIQFKLEQAKAMGDFNGIAKEIANTLSGLTQSVNIPQLNEMIKQMDVGFENFDAILDSTSESLETMEAGQSNAVSDQEVNEALNEIDVEISTKTGQSLPSTPGGLQTEEIGNLEDEIKRLKAQKNS